MHLKSSVPAFPVVDLAAALDFYALKLGFEERYRNGRFAVIVRDEIELHLWVSNDKSWKRRWRNQPIVSGAESFLAGTASCRFCCEGIDALYANLREEGVIHTNGALKTTPWGTDEFAILDLDGNLITFFENSAA